jgi:hypothetical protein
LVLGSRRRRKRVEVRLKRYANGGRHVELNLPRRKKKKKKKKKKRAR